MTKHQKVLYWIEIILLSMVFLALWFLIDLFRWWWDTIQEHGGTQPLSQTTIVESEYDTLLTYWEKNSYIDQWLIQLAQELIAKEWSNSTDHRSASSTDLEAICDMYSSLCNKTKREWKYTQHERLNYQWLLIYLIQQLDRTLTTQWSLKETISSIHLSPHHPDRRWSAWHTHARFNTSKIDSWNEFFQVSVHEMMHIIDLWMIQWRSVFKDTNFTEFWKITWSTNDPSIDFYKISRVDENTRKQYQWPEHFVSGYALKNVYEDVAETFSMYLLYHDLFAKKAKTNDILMQKYQYASKVFWWKYLQSWNMYLNSYNTTHTYWDITRLFEDLS